jgi:hypothetical protein
MVPDSGSERGGVRDPELGAAPEDDGVVIEHRRHNEGAVKQRGGHRCVSELPDLVVEPAVRSVPQEPLAIELPRDSAPWRPGAVTGGGEGEQGAQHGGVGGVEEERDWEEEHERGHDEGQVWPRAPPAPPAAARREVHVAGDAAGSDLTVGKGAPSTSYGIDSVDRPLDQQNRTKFRRYTDLKKSKIYLSPRLFQNENFHLNLSVLAPGCLLFKATKFVFLFETHFL